MVTMLVEVNNLIERGVFIKTLDGRLDTSLMNDEIVRLIVGVMGYAAECELRNIKHRTSEGRAVAKIIAGQAGSINYDIIPAVIYS